MLHLMSGCQSAGCFLQVCQVVVKDRELIIIVRHGRKYYYTFRREGNY